MNRPESAARPSSGSPSDTDIEEAVPGASSGKELRVGIFVLIGLVSFFAVLYLTTDPALFRGRYIVTTTVDNAGGVRQGDPVLMRGVNIGRVHRFGLTEDMVEIALEIEGEWSIPMDSQSRITGTGLLGGRTIEIVRGEASEVLPPGGSIPGTSTEDITQEAQELSAEARSTLQRIQALLSEPTVSALQGSAQELDSLLVQLNAFAREQRGQVDRLTESLNRSAEGLEEVAAAGPDAARAIARADSALAQLNETGETLDRAAGSLDNVLARLDRGEGTLGRLARDDSLYVNLNRAAESAHRLMDDLRENPGRYVTIEIF